MGFPNILDDFRKKETSWATWLLINLWDFHCSLTRGTSGAPKCHRTGIQDNLILNSGCSLLESWVPHRYASGFCLPCRPHTGIPVTWLAVFICQPTANQSRPTHAHSTLSLTILFVIATGGTDDWLSPDNSCSPLLQWVADGLWLPVWLGYMVSSRQAWAHMALPTPSCIQGPLRRPLSVANEGKSHTIFKLRNLGTWGIIFYSCFLTAG